MSFKDELLNDRLNCYKKYRDISPFYDKDLKSHIILNYKDTLSILKSPSSSANRKKEQLKEISSCPYANQISEFYEKWLMYMEGDLHKEYRKIVFHHLSSSMISLDNTIKSAFSRQQHKLFSNRENFDIVSEFCRPFIIDILSELFGISPTQYEHIINISKPISDYISSGDLGNEKSRKDLIESLDETYDYINKLLPKIETGFIKSMLKENIDVRHIKPLIINIIIDGFDPLLSAISNYIYMLTTNNTNKEICCNDLFDEMIRLETSFQYCARIAENDIILNGYQIKKGERIIMFHSSANRDHKVFISNEQIMRREIKEKHLSFGAGKHRCLGANLAKKITVGLMNEMNNIKPKLVIRLIECRWIETIGFRSINQLIVNIIEG